MEKVVPKIGFYSAAVACISALGYCVVQVLQILGIITYPLADVLIYAFSLGISSPFLLAMLAVHYSASPEKKIWSHAALLFAVMYTVYVTLMYAVQLGSVIPASLHGSAAGVLTVAPQSLFWIIDALGYICMGIATLFAAFVFEWEGAEKWLRGFFIANGLMVPVITVVYFYPHFSVRLLLWAFPWGITLPGSMLLLCLFFWRKVSHPARLKNHLTINLSPQ